MRLLNTTSLEFEEFLDEWVPVYAILPHRWGKHEVSFQDFLAGRKKDSEGYDKITDCCLKAREWGLEWVWIDTCCIDKQSSAELTEAINSMFRWYSDAKECYAYLTDVHWIEAGTDEEVESSRRSFDESVWFKRGWTLQELLAPKTVLFFDKGWTFMETREKLSKRISAVTRIKRNHVKSYSDRPYFDEISVATKMSWLSSRKTSRREDIAYCMLGLFDVNMPLLYGEGEKAFLRLQLEIIRKSDDESIFAWTHDIPVLRNAYGPDSEFPALGMLAESSSAFANSGDIDINENEVRTRSAYSMTNKGLAFPVELPDCAWDERELATELILNCWKKRDPHYERGYLPVIIHLRKFNQYWRRVYCNKLDVALAISPVGSLESRTVYIKQDAWNSPYVKDLIATARMYHK